MPITETKTIGEKSADTIILEQTLRSADVGDVVSYEDMSKKLGRDVRVHCYSNLQSARRALETESLFFGVIPNEGLKRLTNDEAVVASSDYTRRARSAARRGMRHLAYVPFADLSNEKKQQHLTLSAQLGAIQLFSGSKAADKISKRVGQTSHVLAVGETLNLFTDRASI